MTKYNAQDAKNQTLAALAQDHLGLDSLESRGKRRLDFPELDVNNVRRALSDAYNAGLAAQAVGRRRK